MVGFIEAPGIGLELPLDVRGTAFQQRVWQALREIPVGQTASYTEIARRIGSPAAVRAVAQACATNKLAVAIPAIEWCVTMVPWLAIAGVWSASAHFLRKRRGYRLGVADMNTMNELSRKVQEITPAKDIADNKDRRLETDIG